MAMGIDRAIHVPLEGDAQSLGIAKALAKIVEKEKPDLIIMGKQAIDNDSSQTGPMLAALLGWPQGDVLLPKSKSPTATVKRDARGGWQAMKPSELKLPAVITTDLRLNEPRYAALPNIMKAKKKPIETLTPEQLGVNFASRRIALLKVSEPPKRKAGIKVPDVATLVDKLRRTKCCR